PSSASYIAFSSMPFLSPQATHSLPHALRWADAGSSSPQGYFRPSGPRAANSHSASLGRRLPVSWQNLSAISQSTQLMGCLALPDGSRRLQSGSNALRSLSAIPSHSLVVPARLQWPLSLQVL